MGVFGRKRHLDTAGKNVKSNCFVASLQRNFGIITCSLHKRKVNFSLKKTNCDRGKKENRLQMGSCFIQGLCCQWGRPELGDRMGKWDTPTSGLIRSATKCFSLH